MEEYARHLMLDFVQMKSWCEDPLIVERAEGIRVVDCDGTSYIDGLSGIFVVNLGYGNERVIRAVAEQTARLPFQPQMATNPRALELTRLLLEITPPQFTAVKLASGGSEATEGAIKIARQYHRQTGNPQKYKVLSHYRAYHGATGNSLAATGWARLKVPFEPLGAGFVHLHTPDPFRPPFDVAPEKVGETFARMAEEVVRLEGPDTVAAIVVEPLLMSAGVVVPPDDYMRALREICDRYSVLLIVDEVITGFGRTGTLFAQEHTGAWGDLVCIGKGMSGGYAPLAATLLSERVARAFWGEPERGVQFHAGHTYAGQPVACAAGVAAISELLERGLVQQAARVGDYLHDQLLALKDRHEAIGDARGRGLLRGIEFVRDRRTRERFPDDWQLGNKVAAASRRRGLLLRASPWFAAIGPPLIATEADIDEIVAILDAALAEVTEAALVAGR